MSELTVGQESFCVCVYNQGSCASMRFQMKAVGPALGRVPVLFNVSNAFCLVFFAFWFSSCRGASAVPCYFHNKKI